ncbi:MAG TPA: tetratricopeptide repeat protein [Pyrinomonadaceae bacterium]|jgi:tetratricopeptide (TPR) repeat protein|nr:tetratricopeptide repeat protein [Pyrinomonadaceae bacterium]
MFEQSNARIPRLASICFCLIVTGALAHAQETGGDLVGGAGIFRPKNPEAKRSSGPKRPPRPTMTAAEMEEKYQDHLSDGNDARDDRKFSAAETAYREAIKLKPTDARAFYGLGNLFLDQQRWDDAEDAYRKAYQFAANNPDVLTAFSYVLVQPRSGAPNAKRLSDAEYYATRATQLQPTNAMAFDRLGAAMVARGIVNQDTEAKFRHAVELDPNLLIAQVHLARLLKRQHRDSEAQPIYDKAIAQAKDAPTLVTIAQNMQAEGGYTDSEPVLRKALAMDPGNPGALFLMGRFLSASGKYAEAEPVLKQAIAASPKLFAARSILGRCYLALDRYDDAFRTYDQAVDLASDAERKDLAGTFGFAGIGDGYMKAGRARDAVRAYTRGLQLDPNNASLQTKLAGARAKATS